MKTSDMRRAADDAVRMAAMFAGLAELGKACKDAADIMAKRDEAEQALAVLEQRKVKREQEIGAEIATAERKHAERLESLLHALRIEEARASEVRAKAAAEAEEIKQMARMTADEIRADASAEEDRAKAIKAAVQKAQAKLDSINEQADKAEARLAKAKAAAAAFFKD